MTTNQIIWHQLPNESPDERIARLNETLHRIFFESREVCPDSFLDCYDGLMCHTCYKWTPNGHHPQHSTPRFIESLDAMQLIVESGRFAEVREEYTHWLPDGRKKHECTIFLYGKGTGKYFHAEGASRQDAFYCAALTSQGYTVVQEEQGENNVRTS